MSTNHTPQYPEAWASCEAQYRAQISHLLCLLAQKDEQLEDLAIEKDTELEDLDTENANLRAASDDQKAEIGLLRKKLKSAAKARVSKVEAMQGAMYRSERKKFGAEKAFVKLMVKENEKLNEELQKLKGKSEKLNEKLQKLKGEIEKLKQTHPDHQNEDQKYTSREYQEAAAQDEGEAQE